MVRRQAQHVQHRQVGPEAEVIVEPVGSVAGHDQDVGPGSRQGVSRAHQLGYRILAAHEDGRGAVGNVRVAVHDHMGKVLIPGGVGSADDFFKQVRSGQRAHAADNADNLFHSRSLSYFSDFFSVI